MTLRRMPSLLVALVTCCLLVAGPAPARQSGDPPVPGERFEWLLGLHRDSPMVVSMMKWAKCWPLAEGKKSTSSGGLTFEFQDDRVSKIGLTIRSSTEPTWGKSLPLGLTYKTKSSDLRGRSEWGLYAGRSTYRAGLIRPFLGRQFEGIRGEAVFNSLEQLLHVRLLVTPREFWDFYSDVIQDEVPVTHFKSGAWLGLLGADIATDDGSLLAAWAGVPVTNTEGQREGLHVGLADRKWIDKIAFDARFKGELPFGLGHPVTLEKLAPMFGPTTSDSAESSVSRWTLTFPRHWPLHVELDVAHENGPLLTLGCKWQQVEAWNKLTSTVGPPSAALVQDILKLWDLSSHAPQSLLGRTETVDGLLGRVSFWHSTFLIRGAVGGVIRDSESYIGPGYRTVEYVLRSYPGSAEVQVKDQLDAFEEALSKPLAKFWRYTREEGSGSMEGALSWAAEVTEPLSPTASAELRVEARAVDGGSELRLLMKQPLKGD